jgi:hypothetical protein
MKKQNGTYAVGSQKQMPFILRFLEEVDLDKENVKSHEALYSTGTYGYETESCI